jgi:hypothetical protein
MIFAARGLGCFGMMRRRASLQLNFLAMPITRDGLQQLWVVRIWSAAEILQRQVTFAARGRCLRACAGRHRRADIMLDPIMNLGLCPLPMWRKLVARLPIGRAENDPWRQCHLDQRNIV